MGTLEESIGGPVCRGGITGLLIAVAFGLASPALAQDFSSATLPGSTAAGANDAATSRGVGGSGGGAAADFDSLIELIQTTVSPTSWDDVGGPGAISEYATGVYVDADGVLRKILREEVEGTLARLHGRQRDFGEDGEAGRDSALRMVSLPRLESAVRERIRGGQRPSEAMQVLAGLRRVEFVFVYPESGDLVVAGPAGDWTRDWQGRFVAPDGRSPLVRLDDLVAILRGALTGREVEFGCTITPTTEGLASTQQFLRETAAAPLPRGGRDRWLEDLRATLGLQDIRVQGLAAGNHAARVMVEADYHMKLVGMGIEPGVPGVESYLESARRMGRLPESMDILRWWFTLDYDAVLTSEDLASFAIRGQGLKVLSENELLDALGKRIHTGNSEELNRRFANSFTRHFRQVCAEYPIYGELRNLADLALAVEIIRQHGLVDLVGWAPDCFAPDGEYILPRGRIPRQVPTVINALDIRRGEFLVGASGGVLIDPGPWSTVEAMEVDRYDQLDAKRVAAGRTSEATGWWWD